MNEREKILIVDDDPNIAYLLSLYLEKEGYETQTCGRGDEAVEMYKREPYNLVLLDVMLPGIDGWEVLRQCRQVSTAVPIIMLTAKDQTFDKVLGLYLGADDYITKPFDAQEMIARVRAVMRRSQPTDDEKKIVYPNLQIDMDTYDVVYRGQAQHLPPKEIELLYYLATHPNRVYTREQLLEQVWGFDFFGDSRTVDVHIKRLREKIGSPDEPWQIKTVWGVGYKFEVQ